MRNHILIDLCYQSNGLKKVIDSDIMHKQLDYELKKMVAKNGNMRIK